MDALTRPGHLATRSEVLARPCPVPKKPGIYAWYFDVLPPGLSAEGCHGVSGHTLLYVGISPSGPPTSAASEKRRTLQRRITIHYKGNAYSSTLRLTLGCLLAGTLGITLQRVGSGKCRTFTNRGEQALDAWMDQNAKVVWVPLARPWEIEAAVIGRLWLPLNIMDNERHPFCSTLREVRKAALHRALDLPIAPRDGTRFTTIARQEGSAR
ncbi:GIY-YIG nuclease family protein [Falsiroseomonas sp. HW251]|uniref:GIY-YIG nuclease family protein n=1 Tax=Falsiroseomonas sp. HW251 TaxID=3390998 RepID=UPI003D321E61